MSSKNAYKCRKFLPGGDEEAEEIFQYPFFTDQDTVELIQMHRVMFLIRGVSGTGKDSVCKLITDTYKSAVVCSADLYFTEVFAHKDRSRQSLSDSHVFCHEKVQEACANNENPIVVKNTHVKKYEFDTYLRYANKFNYIVIMIVTMDKFDISPEILAKSNTKGLTAVYFRSRLNQWCNCYPKIMGWFLSPSDGLCLLKHLKDVLDAALGDGKFCHVFDAYSIEDLLESYSSKKMLYCAAAWWNSFIESQISKYYFSDVVQENYGKRFTLSIEGFLVTKKDILAVVELNDTMLDLVKNSDFPKKDEHFIEEDIDLITSQMGCHTVGMTDSVMLSNSFDGEGDTLVRCQRSKEINVKKCNLFYLAKGSYSLWPNPSHYMNYWGELDNLADEQGIISSVKFNELENQYLSCRIPNDIWLIRPPQSILVDGIFTGIY